MKTNPPRKWQSFINQENEEIRKIDFQKIWEKLMVSELLPVVLFEGLNYKIYSNSSETNFWVKMH